MKFIKGRDSKEYRRRVNKKRADPFYTSTAWRQTREAFIQRNGAICAICGSLPYGRDLHIDHITPIKDGGSKFDFQNMQILCSSCHSRKSLSER